MTRSKAPCNRTITLEHDEKPGLEARLLTIQKNTELQEVTGRVLHQKMEEAAGFLPKASVDLLFLDPPYNLNRQFGKESFRKCSPESYSRQFEAWLQPLLPLLKPTASIYVCADWQTSSSIDEVLAKYFLIRNRITWEREKGRGALRNWKNASEDIWFCTCSESYCFHVERVKLKRRVMAPYRDREGLPKDWTESKEGAFRLTHPSNLWTDLTVPFWSMPENTGHPTQKPEKLLAKLILASSEPGDVILDPFCGSGTALVAAKKLGRRFVGIEQDLQYACLAEKRLRLAEVSGEIQGYSEGVFWERNTGMIKKNKK